MASRLEPAIGDVDGVNRDFSLPSAYRAGSLVVFLNGQQLKRELENGWEELDPAAGTFRMKLPPVPARPGSSDDPGDVLYGYFDLDYDSIGGAEGGVPKASSGEVVLPRSAGSLELRPRAAGAEGGYESTPPSASAALELRPTPRSATVLRPKIAGSEET